MPRHFHDWVGQVCATERSKSGKYLLPFGNEVIARKSPSRLLVCSCGQVKIETIPLDPIDEWLNSRESIKIVDPDD